MALIEAVVCAAEKTNRGSESQFQMIMVGLEPRFSVASCRCPTLDFDPAPEGNI